MPILKRAWFCDQSPGRGGIVTLGPSTGGGGGAGAFYAEMRVQTLASEYSACFGIGGSGFDLSNPIAIAVNLPQGSEGVVWSVASSGAAIGWGDPTRAEASGAGVFSDGDWAGLAFNTSTGLLWMRNATAAPTVWYGTSGAGTADPVTLIEGFDFSTAITGAIFLLGGVSQVGNADATRPIVTLNAGGSAFAATAPTGYVAFNAAATWNTADADSHLSFSGGNLVATVGTQIVGSNQPTAFVRSTVSKLR